jgi:C-terminal processing protease CtpA/Prc
MSWVLLVALMAPAAVGAQEEEEPDYQAAQQSVQEAVETLRAALEDLRSAQQDEANFSLQEAIEQLRAAQRNLRSDEYNVLLNRLIVGEPGNVSLFVSEGRPKMGVVIEEMGQRSASDSIGAKLSAVTPGGPADEAGLKAGDIVMAANGVSLARVGRSGDAPGQKLVKEIQKLDDGEDLVVEYMRDGERKTATVTVRKLEPSAYSWSANEPGWNFRVQSPDNLEGVYEEDSPHAFSIRSGAPTVISSFMPFAWFDMELVELNEDLGQYFGTTEGILVVRAPESDDVPLEGGDVILSIDGRVPTNPAHALRIMRSYEPGESMTMDIMRDRQRQTVTVEVPARERSGGFLWEPRR